MPPFDPLLFFAAFGAGLSLILAAIIARDFFHTLTARLFILLLVAANVHLFHPWLPQAWHGYSFVVQSASPALFWMCCRLTFVAPDEPRRLLWGLAFYSFLGPLLYLLTGTPDGLHLLLKGIPQWLEYLLILAGLWEVISNWNNDLVEARRRLRGGVMLAMGLAVGWGIFSFNMRIGDNTSRYLALDVSMLILAWLLMQGRSELWRLLPQPAPAAADNNMDHEPAVTTLALSQQSCEELQMLQELMNQGFYRRENLTLAILAQELGIPEYRLRATINKALNYNNFNEYINELRIGEAADRLLNEAETPITNIALDVGYRTMSSFNRAFRKIHHSTPSDYREHRGQPPHNG
ncbi:helix-turn-helix domain-containing protein [Thalassolituus sp. C2-1]|uniref:AraC family transcriptional regulator n=1 Tax=Venatorbacter sp. C2-1 TaxID=2597518 RepID=UPI001193E1D2|nr:helix-turn-helix domain-containing protein [Thalassolituus sp. C2-1]TVV44041.1 AraC family transcriptional regulator [Thalassolituus sp. C2-1]